MTVAAATDYYYYYGITTSTATTTTTSKCAHATRHFTLKSLDGKMRNKKHHIFKINCLPKNATRLIKKFDGEFVKT